MKTIRLLASLVFGALALSAGTPELSAPKGGAHVCACCCCVCCGGSPAATAIDPGEAPLASAVEFDGYFKIQEALAADDLEAARVAAAAIPDEASAAAIASTADIAEAREAFRSLSGEMIARAKEDGVPGLETVFHAHCPMAFGNTGGSWLQRSDTLANPYFGAMMLRCGTLRELKRDGVTK